jgi:hypothetical protein
MMPAGEGQGLWGRPQEEGPWVMGQESGGPGRVLACLSCPLSLVTPRVGKL